MRLDGLMEKAALPARGIDTHLVGDGSAEVSSVVMDSRQVESGSLFACVPGASVDGHDLAPGALAAGAAALLCERPLDLDAPQLVVGSVRRALGPVCDAFHGHPSAALTVAAVTGTNGKTTTCAFLRAIFEAEGWPATAIGTLTHLRTTPEAPELHRLLAEWRRNGGRAVAMEVSSHALAQHRTDAVTFAAGIFTNLTPDHLDYHGTLDAYFEAKARLFEPGRVGVAVINRADPWGARLAERVARAGDPLQTYGLEDASDVELSSDGSRFLWRGRRLRIRIGGEFNVANALAAATCAVALGAGPDAVEAGLESVAGVPGRFQAVDAGQAFAVVVDYAHTPDGIEKLLATARRVTGGRVILVFGAGGDRDREKRPLMGAAASAGADLVVVTSDNPRSEDPESIIEAVLSGMADRSHVTVQVDRDSAIRTALATARPGDLVAIAGKGHEKGQEIAGRVHPFDDVEVARRALQEILSARESR